MKNYYSLLELNDNCTTDEIDKKYKELALVRHPDKATGSHELFCELNNIYSFLKHKRKLYDHLLFDNLIVYDTIPFLDMELVDDEYIYACRCGGQFKLELIDVHVELSKSVCSNCSLCIDIIY